MNSLNATGLGLFAKDSKNVRKYYHLVSFQRDLPNIISIEDFGKVVGLFEENYKKILFFPLVVVSFHKYFVRKCENMIVGFVSFEQAF